MKKKTTRARSKKTQPARGWNARHMYKLCLYNPALAFFLASRPSLPAAWLALLLIKAGAVESNPGPTTHRFQRQQPTSGGTVRSPRPANCCQHIPLNRFHDGFPDKSQFAAAKLTHYSSKPQRPSYFSRSGLRILLSRDVHSNPDPTTKYPCPVCARNVTGRRVS